MFFPLFLKLENKKVLIIGGGKVGFRKSQTLKDYGADITLYSEKITEEEIFKLKDIKIVNRKVEADDTEIRELVKEYFIVIAATDNKNLNEKISHICMEEGILVNNASSKTEMNAMFGAVISNGEFQVAVSTSGKSCKRSKALKGRIKSLLNEIETIGNKGQKGIEDV